MRRLDPGETASNLPDGYVRAVPADRRYVVDHRISPLSGLLQAHSPCERLERGQVGGAFLPVAVRVAK